MNKLVPPYLYIANSLKAGYVIPFLGSGASLGERLSGEGWKDRYLPTALELAEYLARLTEFPPDESLELTKVAQYCNLVIGRDPLYRELHTIFGQDYPMTSLHEFLAEVPTTLLIVTTNYDDLIEQAYRDKNRPFDLVVHTMVSEMAGSVLWWPHGTDAPRLVPPNELDIPLDKVNVIYKMHGGVDRQDQERDSYVIAEDDYIDFLVRVASKTAIPAIFAEPFQKRHFLFLGYGLRDWNLRVVLNKIEKDWPRSIVSWAIQYQPSALEREFWSKRQVKIYDITIEEFIQELERHI
ncbi:MAG: SIR2 family protein [Chloroflexi bacterium]|nr:SIR2 family protein [Chloroflexota bacterium]